MPSSPSASELLSSGSSSDFKPSKHNTCGFMINLSIHLPDVTVITDNSVCSVSESVRIFTPAGGLPTAIFTNVEDISICRLSKVLHMFISAGGFPAGESCPAGPRRPLPRGCGSVRLQSEHFGCTIPWLAGGAASNLGSPFVIHSGILCINSESTVLGATDSCLVSIAEVLSAVRTFPSPALSPGHCCLTASPL